MEIISSNIGEMESFKEAKFYISNYISNCRDIVERINNNNGDDKTIEIYNKIESLILPFHLSMLKNKNYSSILNTENAEILLGNMEDDDEIYESEFLPEIPVYCNDYCNDINIFLKVYKYWGIRDLSDHFISLIISSPKSSIREYYNSCCHVDQKNLLFIIDLNETNKEFLCFIASKYNRLDIFKFLKKNNYPLHKTCWKTILRLCDLNTLIWCLNNIEFDIYINAFEYISYNKHLGLFEYIIDNLYKFNGPFPAIKFFIESGRLDLIRKLLILKERFPIDPKAVTNNIEIADILYDNGITYDNQIIENAIFKGRIDIIEILVKGSIDKEFKYCDIASLSGNLDMLKFLIMKDFPYSRDVLQYAVYSGNLDIVKYIIENCFNQILSFEIIKITEDMKYEHIADYLSSHTKIYSFDLFIENNNRELKYIPLLYRYLYEEVKPRIFDIQLTNNISELESGKSQLYMMLYESIDVVKEEHHSGIMWSEYIFSSFVISTRYDLSREIISEKIKYIINSGFYFSNIELEKLIRNKLIDNLICFIDYGLKLSAENIKLLISNKFNYPDIINLISHLKTKGYDIEEYIQIVVAPHEVQEVLYKIPLNNGEYSPLFAYNLDTNKVQEVYENTKNLYFVGVNDNNYKSFKSFIELENCNSNYKGIYLCLNNGDSMKIKDFYHEIIHCINYSVPDLSRLKLNAPINKNKCVTAYDLDGEFSVNLLLDSYISTKYLGVKIDNGELSLIYDEDYSTMKSNIFTCLVVYKSNQKYLKGLTRLCKYLMDYFKSH